LILFVVFIFWTVMTVFYASRVVKLWKSPEEVGYFEASLAFFPLGRSGKRGEVRAAALTCATLVSADLIVAMMLFSDNVARLSFMDTGAYALAVVVAIVGPLVIEFSVVLFNRPRCVVPPHMRSDKGALVEWIESRRSRQ
jgi:hypothetical protein